MAAKHGKGKKSVEKRLQALEMDYWRRITGKSRTERITNVNTKVYQKLLGEV